MREFDIVVFKNEYIIAGKYDNYSKEEFIKKVKAEYEYDNSAGKLEVHPHTYEVKYGRILNLQNTGRDYNLEDKDVRGNFKVHTVRYTKD